MVQASNTMITNFPSDVLRVLFQSTLYPPLFVSPTSSEILLSHVCRTWRDQLLSTSSFWSSITIGCEWTKKSEWPLRVKFLRAQRRAIETWIERSGEHPLLIAILCENYAEESEVDALLELVDIVARTSGRWKGLFVHAYPRVLRHVAPIIPSKTPRLLNFEIEKSKACDLSELEGCVISLDPFPESSRAIQVTGPSLQFPASRGVWSRLTQFTYFPASPDNLRFSLQDVYRFLSCCPSLVNLTIIVRRESQPAPALDLGPQERLRLQFLDHLSMASEDFVDFGPLLDDLEATNLAFLSLDGERPSDMLSQELANEGWQHLNDFISRCRPPLLALYLHAIPITPESLIRCLSILPAVRTLHLDGSVFDDFFVSMLTWKPYTNPSMDLEEGNILPDLHELLIRDCPLKSPSEQARLTLMVRSRLIHKDILSRRHDGDEEIEMMKGAKDDGPRSSLGSIWLRHRRGITLPEIYSSDHDLLLLIINPILRPYRKRGLLGVAGDSIDTYTQRAMQMEFEDS